MIDIQKFVGGIHDYLSAQVAPIVKRLEAIEAAKPADGKDGRDGVDGKDGASVDAEAVAAMVQEAVSAIPVPKDGTNGTDGTSVPLEEVERMVSEAVAKAVAAIKLPQDGAPGRDAIHLEILPAIAEAKSYPRGTYAKHAGGLWRSFESTEGMRGWECIVEGVAAIDVQQVERGFTVTAQRSSGATEVKTLTLPVMMYQGVFKEGETYDHGDMVTWGGSLWHCDVLTRDKPGEPNVKAWTLAAKRGRDGKDGTNGKDFTKAVQL